MNSKQLLILLVAYLALAAVGEFLLCSMGGP